MCVQCCCLCSTCVLCVYVCRYLIQCAGGKYIEKTMWWFGNPHLTGGVEWGGVVQLYLQCSEWAGCGVWVWEGGDTVRMYHQVPQS